MHVPVTREYARKTHTHLHVLRIQPLVFCNSPGRCCIGKSQQGTTTLHCHNGVRCYKPKTRAAEGVVR